LQKGIELAIFTYGGQLLGQLTPPMGKNILFEFVIQPPWHFKGRSRRPPEDPVTAVLSFGYVVVGSQIQMLMDGIGLDPYLGFYHQVDYGRPSLALDLLEEFRHPLVDRLAASLFNKGVFEEADFFKPASPQGSSTPAVYLSTSGKRKFFLHYEKTLGEISPELKSGEGFFPLFQRQIQGLIRAIQEDAPYQPFQLS